MKLFPLLVLVAALALVGGGCTGQSTVEEPDRQLVDMNIQIAQKQRATLELLAACITNDPVKAQEAAVRLAELEQQIKDAEANNRQLQENWGPPKEAVPYTPQSAEQVRQGSKAAHSSKGFWGWLAGVGAVALTIGAAIIRSPLAKLIPGVGPGFQIADAVITGAEAFMNKQKAAGHHDVAADLASTLKDVQAKAGLQPHVAGWLERVKKKAAGTPLAAAAELVTGALDAASPAAVKDPTTTEEETKILTPPGDPPKA